MYVRFGLGRVLSNDVERAELTALHGLEHERQMPARLVRDRRPPDFLELRAVRVVLDVLEPGELVRQGSHVSAALHVVLSAEGTRVPSPSGRCDR